MLGETFNKPNAEWTFTVFRKDRYISGQRKRHLVNNKVATDILEYTLLNGVIEMVRDSALFGSTPKIFFQLNSR